MIKISASLMCANQLYILRDVQSLISLNIDLFHLDVIDGGFANNLALNLELIREIRKLTNIPLDVHLMVQEPSLFFDKLIEAKVDIIVFPFETKENIIGNIHHIKSHNIKAGLAIDLDTSVDEIDSYLPYLDYVLVMAVKSGFSGLSFSPKCIDKIKSLYSIALSKNYRYKIICDGGISKSSILDIYHAGADIIVAGRSALFNKEGFSKNLQDIRSLGFDEAERRKLCPIEPKINDSFKCAILHDVNDFRVARKDLRPLKHNEVIVRVKSCGICGSDLLRVYKKGMYSKNLVPGHEFSGIIVKTGDSSTHHLVNKRVAVYPLIPCNECEHCKSGKTNLCAEYDYLGSRSDGGFAEYAVVPKDNVVFLSNNISFDEGALIEPLAVTFHAIKKLGNMLNKNVLVLGLGPIGALAGQWAKLFGADAVTGIDRNDYKHRISKRIGFDECAINADELGVKHNYFDCIIECSGSSRLLDSYIPYLAKEGKIMLVGNHEQEFNLSSQSISEIIRGEIKILSSWNSTISQASTNEWASCINYLKHKKVHVAPLITHTAPLDDIVPVFDKLKNKELNAVKVIINP